MHGSLIVIIIKKKDQRLIVIVIRSSHGFVVIVFIRVLRIVSLIVLLIDPVIEPSFKMSTESQ